MDDYREQILALAQTKPLLPNDVAKMLNTNMLMASAMLSELSANKKLKVSKLKIGSSPLYFLPEKEALLENYFASLQEKDRQTAEALKKNKIMRDNAQDPLTRVSLRQINDFSRPLQVKIGEQDELFWKWYLVSDDEAQNLINVMLEPVKKLVEEKVEKNLEQADKRSQSVLQLETAALVQQKIVKTVRQKKDFSNDLFSNKILDFFDVGKIKITERINVKKAGEGDFVVELQSPLGALSYYCKAKDKKKINDADISCAFVMAQLKKLPLLFVSSGELDKTAKLLLEQLKGVLFQKI